jgi:uncharacterized cupredoxin-like copper-binding protein
MRFLKLFAVAVAVVALASACEPGAAPVVETSVPSALQTGAAQAPTLFSDAATAAAQTGGTLIPSAATAASSAAQTAAPAAETAAAGAQTAVGTAVPAAQTAAAAAQTAVATPPVIILPGAATPTPGGNVVEASLSEYKIEMPASLRAGAITFRVTNAGTVEHNFVVEGQGIKRTFDNNLQPNETNTLQVNLTAGTYQVYCPVEGHRSLGMLVNLTVTP